MDVLQELVSAVGSWRSKVGYSKNKKFPENLKRQTLDALRYYSVSQVAAATKISSSALHKWLKQADESEATSFVELPTPTPTTGTVDVLIGGINITISNFSMSDISLLLTNLSREVA